MADWGTYVVMSNGVQMFAIDVASGDHYFPTILQMPLAKTICDYRGQLIIGNTARGENFVEWSNIGDVSFTIGDANVAGFRPMPWNGEVYDVRTLSYGKDLYGKEREYIMVYGDKGIAKLKPADIGFGFELEAKYGLLNRSAIGGSRTTHIFIDQFGYLRKVSEKGIELLGYQEYMAPMASEDIRIVYNDPENEFYISSDSYAFVLSAAGLTQMDQRISGGFTVGDDFVGIRSATVDDDITMVSDVLDFNIRAIKTITYLQISCKDDADLSSIEASAYWKTSDTTWRQTPWRRVNKHGSVRIQASGVDFKIALRVKSYTTIAIDELLARWQVVDKRFLRGTYGAAKAVS